MTKVGEFRINRRAAIAALLLATALGGCGKSEAPKGEAVKAAASGQAAVA